VTTTGRTQTAHCIGLAIRCITVTAERSASKGIELTIDVLLLLRAVLVSAVLSSGIWSHATQIQQ
jgi:hypothetical protein